MSKTISNTVYGKAITMSWILWVTKVFIFFMHVTGL